jgi:hypothetical protein
MKKFDPYPRSLASGLKPDVSNYGTMVRMLAPVGVGSLYTFTGRQITIPDDRIVKVSAEDAAPLKRVPGWAEVKREMEAVG